MKSTKSQINSEITQFAGTDKSSRQRGIYLCLNFWMNHYEQYNRMPEASNVYKSMDIGIICDSCGVEQKQPQRIFYKPLNPQGSENRNKNQNNW